MSWDIDELRMYVHFAVRDFIKSRRTSEELLPAFRVLYCLDALLDWGVSDDKSAKDFLRELWSMIHKLDSRGARYIEAKVSLTEDGAVVICPFCSATKKYSKRIRGRVVMCRKCGRHFRAPSVDI